MSREGEPERVILFVAQSESIRAEPARAIEDLAGGLLEYLGSQLRSRRPPGRVVRTLSRDFCVVELASEHAALLRHPRPRVAAGLRQRFPELRYAWNTRYKPAVALPPRAARLPREAIKRKNQKLGLRIVEQASGHGVPGATVSAYVDFARRMGDVRVTDGRGRVALQVGSPTARLQHLSVALPDGALAYCRTDMARGFSVPQIHMDMRIKIQPGVNLRTREPYTLRDNRTQLGWRDSLRAACRDTASPEDGRGVVVGLIDSGVEVAHPFLSGSDISEVVCHLGTDDPRRALIETDHHGTHLAAIITGIAGLAPAVTLRSFKVFPRGSAKADSDALVDAVIRAVHEEPRCDLINLSVSTHGCNPALAQAIRMARANGVLVVAAAGNEYRRPVAYPGHDLNAIAVSSFGVSGAYPPDADEAAEEATPFSTVAPSHFVARSTNIGYKVAFIGPGVGVLSARRLGGVGAYSGTSQACAAVVAKAACLLAKCPGILSGMGRNWDRSVAIEGLLRGAANRLGFSTLARCPFEGDGSIG